jgi:phage head maturation protease
MKMKQIYGEINKTEQQDDGTIKVWGYASSNSIDSDGETITSDALKNALPDYMKFGAVREMHGNNAAGTAIEASVGEDGKTWFGAHIVDPIAVLKVQTGTYKGFSIGGKVLERDNLNKSVIKQIKLVEISLVDRPANPEAIFTMFKAETIDKDINILDNEEKEQIMDNKEVVKAEVVVEEVIKAEDNTDIKKGLSDVAWLASIVQELAYLQECMENEEKYEKDNSTLPSDLIEVIKTLSNILVASAKEETDELTSSNDYVNIDNEDDSVAYSEKNTDLNKSEEIINLLKGYGLEVVKSKVNEDLNKFEVLNEELQKTIKINEDLAKRVNELENMPKPAKASLMSISKNEELGITNEFEDVIYKSGSNEIDEVATAIKKSQKIRKNY